MLTFGGKSVGKSVDMSVYSVSTCLLDVTGDQTLLLLTVGMVFILCTDWRLFGSPLSWMKLDLSDVG